MGKTSKPLRIAVLSPLDQWEEILKLREQGHQITVLSTMVEEYDVILGPLAHWLDKEAKEYLPLVVKEVRRRRYGSQG